MTPVGLVANVPDSATLSPLRSLRRYLVTGMLSIVILVIGIGGWSAFTKISSAAIAPGTVVVEGSTKKVQHLEGGIIAELHVRNTDRVKAGQILLTLDETDTKALLQITQTQLEELRARRARLIAERDDLANFDPVAHRPADPMPLSGRFNIWEGQAKLFSSRRGARIDRESQLLERVAALQQVSAGLQSQLQAATQQLDFIQVELTDLQLLLDQQLVPRARVLALQRERSKFEGERGRLVAEIARTQVQISETQLQQTESRQTFQSEVLAELREIEAKLSEYLERETAALTRLRRLSILAPIDGVVHKLNVSTVGGVVPAGDVLMEIVPIEEKLLVEGQLDPHRIDQVKPGQGVLLRFTALDHHKTPELKGHVTSISADVRQDAPQLPRYYAVRATIDDGEYDKLAGSRLVPGMPAEMIITQLDRTVLDYLLKPIKDRLVLTFRER